MHYIPKNRLISICNCAQKRRGAFVNLLGTKQSLIRLVCREIRRESNVPIIMITARGEDFEKIMGLEIGADEKCVGCGLILSFH